MANWYVRSAAAGTASGADWTNAKTTLAAAATASAAGDIIYVSEDHAETQASAMTITFPGTTSSPNSIYCVNHAGTVPPVAADLATTATVTTTGANAITIATAYFYMYGVTFNVGTGASAAVLTLNGGRQTYKSCAFNLVTTAATSTILPNTAINLEMDDCSVSFGAVGQSFVTSPSIIRWRNRPGSTAISGATIPTNLFLANGSGSAIIEMDGLDLSAMVTGKTLANGSVYGSLKLTNCKLDSAVTVSATPSSLIRGRVTLIGCGSTTNAARSEIYDYTGTLTTETTIIRTGGASDGTTAYSWKVVTTANVKRNIPFETFEGAIWNTTTGSSKTLSIEIGGPAAMTNADVWLEVEYLGSSATPVASLVSSGPATPLTTGSALTSSAASWGSTPGTTYTLSATFTPNMIGPIRWKVKVAKASATIYIDPKPTVV